MTEPLSKIAVLPAAETAGQVWAAIVTEARTAVESEPDMGSFYFSNVLNHGNFPQSMAFLLASRLENSAMSAMTLQGLIHEAMGQDDNIERAMLADLLAHYHRDAACDQFILPLLFFKGYHALQIHRIAHWFWRQNRKTLATFLQHRVNELYDVDIHPAATLGRGLMLDHATGIVIGETAVVGDDVSMLHGVTLGGSGCQKGGDRHPKVGNGVLLSAGAKLLGNIRIGDGAKIGGGSVVLDDVPALVTVAGVPARPVGKHKNLPALDMNHDLNE